jgi:hypothetical protein
MNDDRRLPLPPLGDIKVAAASSPRDYLLYAGARP